jgi:hypothetical protein
MEWTDADFLREFAYTKMEQDGTLLDTGDKLMSDDEFDRQVQLASEGRWEELGLDPLPSGFRPATMSELRSA